MHEQTPVPRQKRSVFAFHDTQQLPIFRVRIIDDIKAKQAQVASESSEMSICDKSCINRYLQAFLLKISTSRSYWINLDICIVGDAVIKIHRLSVHQDQVNFRMRDAACFDHVFYSRLLTQAAFDTSTTRYWADKEIQVSMEIEPHRKRLHIN